MLRKKIFKNDLNTKTNHVASIFISFLSLFVLVVGIFYPICLLALLLFSIFFLWLNREFLIFVKKKKGWIFAVQSAGMSFFGYLYSGLGFWLGVAGFFKERLREKRMTKRL